MELTNLKINSEYLLGKIKQSSEVGKTKKNGLFRLALSKEDKIIRDKFVSWMQEEKLTVKVDDFGNIYGEREGKFNNLDPIMIGSHLDTQPNGGRFDGVLGVLGGLSVIRTLNDYKINTKRPIILVNFTNEEGARFPQPMSGSGGMVERFSKSYVYNLTDKNGMTFENALKNIDYMGQKVNRSKKVNSYLELHIEQGPILENLKKDIGIVQGIQGMRWLEVCIEGFSNHAGSTPMEDRKDALRYTSEIINDIYTIPLNYPDANITIGHIDVEPNVANVIPGKVKFHIDIRNKYEEVLDEITEILKNMISEKSEEKGFGVHIEQKWKSDVTNFSKKICDIITEKSRKLNYSTLEMYSGPGHDSKHMAEIGDTAMIFIPSCNGISHNESEFSHTRDIIQGTEVLLNTINELANK